MAYNVNYIDAVRATVALPVSGTKRPKEGPKMANEGKKRVATAEETNTTSEAAPVATGEMVTRGKGGDVAVSGTTAELLKSMGMNPNEMGGLEQVQSGGITKWLDLRAFQMDPEAPREKPVKGNGNAFAGGLLGRQEIEVDDNEQGELNADGVKVRYFYMLKLMSPCPVAYKDEEKKEVREVAQPGEIIAVGERHALKALRELCDDGGVYVIVIRPHSRIKVAATRTMWTFDMFKQTIRPPMKVKAELVQQHQKPIPF